MYKIFPLAFWEFSLENIQKGFHSISSWIFGVFFWSFRNLKGKYLHNFDLWLLFMISHVKRIISSGKDLFFWLLLMFWKRLFISLFYWCFTLDWSELLSANMPYNSMKLSENLLKCLQIQLRGEMSVPEFIHVIEMNVLENIFTIYFRLFDYTTSKANSNKLIFQTCWRQ